MNEVVHKEKMGSQYANGGYKSDSSLWHLLFFITPKCLKTSCKIMYIYDTTCLNDHIKSDLHIIPSRVVGLNSKLAYIESQVSTFLTQSPVIVLDNVPAWWQYCITLNLQYWRGLKVY